MARSLNPFHEVTKALENKPKPKPKAKSKTPTTGNNLPVDMRAKKTTRQASIAAAQRERTQSSRHTRSSTKKGKK